MNKADINRRLINCSNDITAAREELRILDEQLVHFADSADDARLRSLVSETPLASREHREAARTVQALQRDREKWLARIAKLEQRQDDLLDQLFEARG